MSNKIDISQLSEIEHIRHRPGMYIGGTDVRALHHMVYEVLDSSAEEAYMERCSEVQLILRDQAEIIVMDNSQGLPVHPISGKDKTALEAILQELGRKHKYDEYSYSITGGLFGAGLATVNALSETFVVKVKHDGYLWQQTYQAGIPQAPIQQIRPLDTSEATGTTITFRPDFTIMQPNEFDYDRLARRCRELASLIKGLNVTIRDERSNHTSQEKTFYYPQGLLTYLEELRGSAQGFHEPIYFWGEVPASTPKREYKIGVEFVIQFTDGDFFHERSFTNTVETEEIGVAGRGLRAGIFNTFQLYEQNPRLIYKNISKGLITLVSIRHAEPQFLGPTKASLANPEVLDIVSDKVHLKMGELSRNVMKTILTHNQA